MQCFAYFPTLVYREECPAWLLETKNNLAPYLEQHQAQGASFVTQTENLAQNPKFCFLKDVFLHASVQVLKEQGYSTDPYDFFVESMWGQEINSNGGMPFHVHPNTQLCGLYFLESPQNSSYPIFKDPRTCKSGMELWPQDNTQLTNASSEVHFSNVLPGSFFIVNSWLQHSLSINLSNEKTKLIHFTVSHKSK
jgi:uncharacterized protein (TIGR02466 family)